MTVVYDDADRLLTNGRRAPAVTSLLIGCRVLATAPLLPAVADEMSKILCRLSDDSFLPSFSTARFPLT